MTKRLVLVALGMGALAACAGDRDDPPSPSGQGPSGPVVSGSTPTAAPSSPPATGRVAHTDAIARAPTFLWADAPARPRIAAGVASPAEAARAHVVSFARYYRLAPEQAGALDLRELHDTGRGAIIARFGRRVDGVEVFGEQLSVAMDRNLDAVALTGFVTGDLPAAAKQPGRRARDAFASGSAAAITAAMSDLAGAAIAASDFEAAAPAAGGYQAARLRPAAATRVAAAADAAPTRAKPIFFRIAPDSLVPAYYVEADLGDDAAHRARHVAYVIDAGDGRVLWRNDLTAYDNPVTYRAYADASGLFTPWDGPQGTAVTPHPTGLADGFQPLFVPAQLVTLSSLTAVGVDDPWLPVGATETLGNNVDAYLDLAAPDGFLAGTADLRGVASAPGVFDYTFDTELGADENAVQRLAAVTQLFYDNNWFHDWYYAAGFTEAAGNAQLSNFGRGGVEGDVLRAEAQDSGGFNNANMSTPADGGRPRMQMYLWTKPIELRVTVAAPPELAGDFTSVGTAVFGPLNFELSADIARASPVDACAPLVGDYAGKIVLVDRGGPAACNGFAGKAQQVQAAGGAGVIIANVAASANPTIPPAMGGTPTVPITIGAVSLNLADGDRFRGALAAGSAVTGQLVRRVKLLDGDIDNQVVAHEWGHYISNRLIFDAAGLQNNMARGLGEGWADFHALLVTAREEDTASPLNDSWQGTYAMGAYATSSDPNSYYFGIRRYPYSTDMTKNPMTFRHISDVNPLPASPPPNFIGVNSQVHATGTVWATMLWECYAGLLRDTVGPAPRLTFAQARDRMRDYVVAAYKVTPANPTLLEARDALLLTALLGDPADYQVCGAAFARRGAGVNAIAPPRGENTNTPVVESFAFGPAVQQTGARLLDDDTAVCAADGILDDGETGTLRVAFRNVGNADAPALSATVSSTTPGIVFPDGNAITFPATARAATAEATVRVAASGLAANTTISIAVATPDAGAGEAAPVTYQFAGNADELPGQSNVDNAELSTVWGQTSSLPSSPPDALWTKVSTSPGGHAYQCRSASVAATAELSSPRLAVAPGQALVLSFLHRHSLERDAVNNLNFDGGVIEVSTDDGATWTDVSALPGSGVAYTGLLAAGNPLAGRPAFTGTSAGYPSMRAASVNLGTSAGGRVVRIRFRVASDPGVSSPGWEIDDIQVSGLLAPPFPGLVPQSATCNAPPVANAGADQTVPELGPGPAFPPMTVFLDASASIDPDGEPLTYRWSQVSGPAVTLDDPAAVGPRFFAPPVLRDPGSSQLVFQLVVSDGSSDSAAALTTVTVLNVNRPPVASAGPAQTVDEGSTVTVDGTGSVDPDPDDSLTYQWTQIAGPPVTLSSATAARPTFVAPEAVVTGIDVAFRLVVSDGLATSPAATTVIHVRNVNRPPVANAGPPQTVVERTAVTLDGTASSDPDGDLPLTYEWTAPAGIALSSTTAAQPTFPAPEVGPAGATFTFSLVVRDAVSASSPATVTVTVTNAAVNRPPVASAGPPQTVGERTTATLDGTGSSDPDGDALTYAWTAPAGITLSSPTAARPTFIAPEVGRSGRVLRFTLVVRDPGGLASPPATVDVSVTNVNRPPVANAGADITVRTGDIVFLRGSGSDPDGDSLRFAWTAPAGVILFLPNTATPFFIAPIVPSDRQFNFRLVVTDSLGLPSAPDTVVVTVRRRR